MRERNEYGAVVKYDEGDVVKIWTIYQNPEGKVEYVVDKNAYPIKYAVRYTYKETGKVYVEEFEQGDLTLVERRNSFQCNCSSNNGVHVSWCNNYYRHKK